MRCQWVTGWIVSLGFGAPLPAATNAGPALELVPPTVLAFDADLKQVNAKAADQSASFTFFVTNVCLTNVLILEVNSSCGCTVAQLPSQPWILQPLEAGPINVTLDIRGRRGLVLKSVQVTSSAGVKALVVRANLPEPAATPFSQLTNQSVALTKTSPPVDPEALQVRARNLQVALGDRQAVFKGGCARCHAEPAHAKAGRELYLAVCGICHEAAPRLPMVPDLRQCPGLGTRDSLRQTIALGKPATLMPGFARSEQGPLSDEQVLSLVAYLSSREFITDGPTNAAPVRPVPPVRRPLPPAKPGS
jgi:mono/diheme cytochrome c family protein